MSGHTPWREIKHKAKPGGSMAGMGYGERDQALLAEIYLAAEKEANAAKGADSFFFFETLLDEAHPTSKLFYDKLIAAALLHAKKQRDYGKEGDPFANVRASEEWGVPGWVGAMIRATDKVRRLQTHATRGSLINESVEDSLLDLAVYSLIALVLYEQDLATKG